MSEMESRWRIFAHPEVAKTLIEMWELRNQVAHGMIEEDCPVPDSCYEAIDAKTVS